MILENYLLQSDICLSLPVAVRRDRWSYAGGGGGAAGPCQRVAPVGRQDVQVHRALHQPRSVRDDRGRGHAGGRHANDNLAGGGDAGTDWRVCFCACVRQPAPPHRVAHPYISLSPPPRWTYIIPLMIAAMISKWTGDRLTHGSIYEEHIKLNDYPYLGGNDELGQPMVASDVMQPRLVHRQQRHSGHALFLVTTMKFPMTT